METSESGAAPRRRRGRANEIDALVGRRVRQRRMLLGMSQSDLANALGITFQQLQKYERGLNRVGAGRLYDLSHALQVPVGYFFEAETEGGPADVNLQEVAAEPARQRETVDLVRAYYGLQDQAVRRRVLDLVRALSQACGSPGAAESATD